MLNDLQNAEQASADFQEAPQAAPQSVERVIYSVARDITARERAAAALRESHERFEMVSRATNDAVWDWDLVAGTVWWNPGYESLFGHRLARSPAGPESWYEHIHPEDLVRVRGIGKKTFAQMEPYLSLD